MSGFGWIITKYRATAHYSRTILGKDVVFCIDEIWYICTTQWKISSICSDVIFFFINTIIIVLNLIWMYLLSCFLSASLLWSAKFIAYQVNFYYTLVRPYYFKWYCNGFRASQIGDVFSVIWYVWLDWTRFGVYKNEHDWAFIKRTCFSDL